MQNQSGSKRNTTFGLLLALAGSLLITPDTLLIRWSGLEGWALSAWRGLLVGVSMLAIWLLISRGSIRNDLKCALSLPFLMIVAATTFQNIAFNFAVLETSITVVLTALATMPVIAAVLSFLMLGEKTHRSTWIVMLVAMFGVGIVVFNGDGATSAPSGSAVLGGLLGFTSALTLALVFVLSRKHPRIPIVLCVAIGTVITGFIGFIIEPSSATFSGTLWVVLLMGVVVLPLSFAALTIAPRYTSSTNVSMLMLLEMVLGPFWVWWGTGEQPSAMMIGGGVLVLIALLYFITISSRRASH